MIFIITSLNSAKKSQDKGSDYYIAAIARLFIICVNIFFLLSFMQNTFAEVVISDDYLNKIILEKKPTRIITLAPDLTEIVFALNAGDKIVGTIDASDYPKAALKIPRVGSYTGLDLERIIALKPDLILTWGNNFSREIAALKKFNIPVYVNAPKRLVDVLLSIKKIGYLLGEEKNAEVLTRKYSTEITQLMNVKQHKKIAVFYEIGDSYFTINKHSWINDVINLCGATNIFADMTMDAAEVSLESIVTKNPDVIIASSQNDEWQKKWLVFSELKAVKNHSLITIDPNLINRVSPRLIFGAKEICTKLQRIKE